MSSASSQPQGRVILLRHGETEWSRSGQHTGATDLPLLPEGEQAARDLAPRLAELDVAAVYSSPLSRAVRTAELAGLTGLVIDDDLREWDYGGYEGLSTPQIREKIGNPTWEIFADGVVPGDTPGETVEDVAARASHVLRRIYEDRRRGDVVLAGHGHASRILTSVWLREEPRFGAKLQLDAGRLCILGQHHGIPTIERWNAR
ncbi:MULTISPECIES: histidine phosphatase family protein [Barrientosiimonas]|uniref:histidine phosphatase family protein n=1 Tax=Barrientosiimonas TaxID=1535207 RepID=UPI0011546867|nr:MULTISPECIES: histidine phosphatase family protein [Barrientosiimonas]